MKAFLKDFIKSKQPSKKRPQLMDYGVFVRIVVKAGSEPALIVESPDFPGALHAARYIEEPASPTQRALFQCLAQIERKLKDHANPPEPFRIKSFDPWEKPKPIGELGAVAAAKRLGVSRATLWRLIQAKKLQASKSPQGKYRFNEDVLDEWLRQHYGKDSESKNNSEA